MLNNFQSYQIIFSVGLGFYLGSVLAQIVNTLFFQPEPAKFNYSWIKNILLRNIIIGALGGFAALAIGSVDVGYLESFSLVSIFFYAFFMSLFSSLGGDWIKLIKLIFSKVIPAKNNNYP